MEIYLIGLFIIILLTVLVLGMFFSPEFFGISKDKK